MKWDHRAGSGLERLVASLIAGVAIMSFFGALAAPAEDLVVEELLLHEQRPLSEGDLSVARGGAVLPWGMSVEVTTLSRVLVDGEDLAASSVASALPLGLESGTWAALADSGLQALNLPMAITNSDSSISIGQFREINIEIRDIPISLGVAPAFPAEVFSPSLVP